MIQKSFYFAGVLVLLLAAPSFAADDDSNDLSGTRRYTFGIRLQAYPLKMFDTKTATSSFHGDPLG